MTARMYQCCYTNATRETAGKISAGWQTVAVSPDIPADAYNACVGLLNANSSMETGMTDERGNVLNLLEIIGDGSYLYLIRTQYGLSDLRGRPNMFAHAFLTSWKEPEVLSDPNTFLTVDDVSFRSSEESAAAMDEPVRRPPFTLEAAMSRAGLSRETYLTLIRCVYAQMTERKVTEPLFVQYDGTAEQMRAFLYCIYRGLPYFLRRTLRSSAAGGVSMTGKHLIFSERARQQSAYFLPQTGENTLLSPKTERKLDRFGFVDYVVRGLPDVDGEAYFSALERQAVRLGDPQASNELILKIAHQMLEGEALTELDDGTLDGRLSDALRSRSRGSAEMDEYIAALLREVDRRNLALAEESEANLMARLEEPVSDVLTAAGEEYHLHRFSALPPEVAAAQLAKMPMQIFVSYRDRLAGSPGGAAILDLFFSTFALPDGAGWEELQRVLRESSVLPERPKTVRRVEELAWNCYCQALPEQAVAGLDAYLTLLGQVLEAGALEDRAAAAKEKFWNELRFEQLDFQSLSDYATMSVDCPACRLHQGLLSLPGILRQYGEDAFFRELQGYFCDNRRALDGPAGDSALDALLQAVLPMTGEPTRRLRAWMLLSAGCGDSVLPDLIREMRLAGEQGSSRALEAAYTETWDLCRGQPRLQDALNGAVLQICQTADCPSRPVPLDLWLALGMRMHANAFAILDAVKPAILEEASGENGASSRLLAGDRCRRDAEAYIQGKGQEARAVKRWLGQLRQAEKHGSDRNGDGPEEHGVGGLLRGLFGRR